MEVRRLPNFLTDFDATCILWVVKHRLILSQVAGEKVVWLILFFHVFRSLFCLQVSFDRAVCLGNRFKS